MQVVGDWATARAVDWLLLALFPGPSIFFNHFVRYTRTKEDGLVCVNDINVYLDRKGWRRSPWFKRTSLRGHASVCPCAGFPNIVESENFTVGWLFRMKNVWVKCTLSVGDPLPMSTYLDIDNDFIHMVKWTFSLCFCILWTFKKNCKALERGYCHWQWNFRAEKDSETVCLV